MYSIFSIATYVKIKDNNYTSNVKLVKTEEIKSKKRLIVTWKN